MKSNPYINLINKMQTHGAAKNPPSITIATVVQSPPNLQIQIGALLLDSDNILIADYLVNNYSRSYSIDGDIAFNQSINGVTNDEYIEGVGSHSHNVTSSANINTNYTSNGQLVFNDTLSTGDLLAVMPTSDEQTYIVLCKLLSLAQGGE